MNGKINFRLSKSGETLFKSKSYQIRINGNSIGQIDSQSTTLSEKLPIGKYSIEVGENDSFTRKDVFLAAGQVQTITINPSLTYPFFRGFLIGIAIVTIFVQFLILEKISIPLMFIPLIPLLVFRKEQFDETCALTILKA